MRWSEQAPWSWKLNAGDDYQGPDLEATQHQEAKFKHMLPRGARKPLASGKRSSRGVPSPRLAAERALRAATAISTTTTVRMT